MQLLSSWSNRLLSRNFRRRNEWICKEIDRKQWEEKIDLLRIVYMKWKDQSVLKVVFRYPDKSMKHVGSFQLGSASSQPWAPKPGSTYAIGSTSYS
jgi:hypothetical protein